MNNIAKHTNGMSIAELKELLIKLENALAIRKKMLTSALKSSDKFGIESSWKGIRENMQNIVYLRAKLANSVTA
jgi:hypothetical protein